MNAFADLQQALDQSAVVRPQPELSTLVVTGEERLSWLSGLLTNDVGKLEVGQATYALAVNRNGKVQSDVWVVVEAERVLLGVPTTEAEALVVHLDHYLIMEDAEIAVAEGSWRWWLAHGPEAEAVANAARAVGADASLTTFNDWPTAVVAAEGTVHPNLGEELTKPEGTLLATPAGWDRLRVARGLAAFGVDYGSDAYPQEARLETFAVSFNKGCYLGQEAVFMLEKRGKPPRRLVRLELDASVGVGSPVQRDGTKVGKITTAVELPDGPRALAMLKTKHSDEGTAVTIGEVGARVL